MNFCVRSMVLSVSALLSVNSFANNLEYMGEVTLFNTWGSSTSYAFPGQCPSIQNPRVSALMLQVVSGRASVDYFAVQFQNGNTQQLPVRNVFEQNSNSRLIPLDNSEGNGGRCVSTIAIQGQALADGHWGNSQRAVIRIWGTRTAVAPQHAHLLGATNLEYRRDADDIFLQCPSERNTVGAVQLAVRGNQAEINRVVLVFGNGTTQTLQVKGHFQPGSVSRIIDLAGGERCIKQIHIDGRTSGAEWGMPRQARVEVFGFR